MEYLNSEEIYYFKYSTDVCRTCLNKSDERVNFLQKDENVSTLIGMLSSIGNFEVKISDQLPTYICKLCEKKLRSSFDFQQLVQRSNNLIQQCLKKTDPINLVFEPANDESEIKIEFVVDDVSKDDHSNNNHDDLSVKTENETIKKKRGGRHTTILPQVSAELVARAIENTSERVHERMQCIKCTFVCSNRRALRVHMSHVHKDAKDYWCTFCNLEVDNLSQHMQQNHANLELKCEFCDRNFNQRSHLTEHLRGHADVRPFDCEHCGKTFVSERHLKIHREIHRKRRSFPCTHCSKLFTTENILKYHVRKKHKNENTAESKDNEKEKDVLSVPDDLLTEPQNYCKECNRRVRSLASHLNHYHSSTATTKKTFLCTLCGKQFTTSSKLQVHNRLHTGDFPYKCKYCDRRVPTRKQLTVHERTHTGEKPHVCDYCGRAFSQSSCLNTHMKIHTGKTEKCSLCTKTFCRPAQLRLHMRQHTGEKPYLCKVCGKGFKQGSHLVEHLNTHTKQRSHKCSYCDKAFTQSSALKTHIQIHLGTKPFKCSQCSYACRQSYSLSQHMKQHIEDLPMPDKPFLCHICCKNFSTVAMLQSHEDLVHTVAS